MTGLGNIPRISRPSARAFRRAHVSRLTPVVITGLFEGQPVSRISRQGAARRALGSMRIKTRLNYVKGWQPEDAPTESKEVQEATLSEYLDFVAANPDTDRLCVEFETPDELRQLFTVPPHCLPEGTSGDGDLLSLLFVAARGSSAHLHFDTDHRQVLLYQVFGRKRVIIIPANMAKKVVPLGSLSMVFLENLTPRERTRFREYCGGYETVLRAGEALYIPALAWHYVDYVDTSMSFSLRFGRSPHSRYIATNVYHDLYVQNVATKLLAAIAPERVMRKLNTVVSDVHPTPLAKHRAVRAAFERLYAEMCPDAIQSRYCLTNFDAVESQQAVDYYSHVAGVGEDTRERWRR